MCDKEYAAQAEEYEFHAVPAEGILDAHGYWWTSNEDSLADQDACLAEEDEEYNKTLITFHQAKEALRNARVAREFYPVVVPASVFVKTRKSKGKGKGRRKGKSRGRGKSSGKSRGKGRKSGKPPMSGRSGKPPMSGRSDSSLKSCVRVCTLRTAQRRTVASVTWPCRLA